MQDSINALPRPVNPGFPGLRLLEIRASLIGWGLYMAALTCYCMIYQRFVSISTPDLQGSVIWALREWGVWLLITPVALKMLRRHETARRIPLFLRVGAGALLVSLTFRIGLDVVTGERGAAASLVIFFPRHLAALTAIILVWHLLLRNRPPAVAVTADGGSAAEPVHAGTVLVHTGNGECLIRVERIQFVSAAGNYVEIHCDGKPYLMRATMKQVEKLLPPPAFLRTHRSHIVNVDEIERIKTRPSGDGLVQLRCGKVLNVGRKYRQRIQRYRPRLT